ncbi:hypothetical protein [Methylobacterium sp. GXS13]|uniref:hypothetical protein n=1 Tax=Methylobacterium sp. GXS13 TaxID=1730094 RepID=UPI000A89654B|nr:hypothetical protein [Methylobacterium sp. GXS13]
MSSKHLHGARTLGVDAGIPAALNDRPTRFLTPSQHASLILPPGGKGMLVAGRRDRQPVLSRTGEREYRIAYVQVGAMAGDVAQAITGFDVGGEILVSMNTFRPAGVFGGHYSDQPNKRLSNLLQFRANFAELDFYKRGDWRRRTAQEMIWIVLDRCNAEGIPSPSYIVSSGRGLHVVWLTEGVPSVALRAWKAVQKRLAEVFHDMGPDKVGSAPTSNLRLAGTSNRGVPVTMIWPSTVGQIQRFSFRGLCDETLPYSPEQCREYREAAAAKKAARKASAAKRVANGGSPALGVETYRAAMEADLWKLLDHRYPAGVRIRTDADDDGTHDRFLFAFARLWACRMDADEIAAEVERHARRLGYRTPRQAVGDAGAVIRRRRMADNGKSHRARPETCGYTFGPQRFVKDFDISSEDARALDLRILVPLAMKAERVAERQAKVRASKGAKPRADAAAERLSLGRQALAFRDAEGLSRPQLCLRMGVKPTLLDKAIREAKALSAIPDAKPVKAEPKRKIAHSRVPSRYIAIAVSDGDALEGVQEPAYTPFVRAKASPSEDRRPVASERIGGPSLVEDLDLTA